MHLSRHAVDQCETKGFSPDDVLLAAEDPDITYPSRNHPGQVRRIRGCLCAVVDPVAEVIVTVYLHMTVTPRRPDQQPHAA